MEEELIPVPVTVSHSRKTLYLQSSGVYGNYASGNLIGSGFQGPETMTRIIMSLKSGIDSEVEWGLMMLSQISCTSANLINLEKAEYLGHELTNYFIKPYHRILNGKFDQVSQISMSWSLDSLLALRNLVQDLENQQWLSQQTPLKRNLVEVLRFYSQWFHLPNKQTYELKKYQNQFREGFNYLLDLIEALSCYYIDTPKNDPLFNQVLSASLLTTDKNVLVNLLKILTHLLFTKGDSGEEDSNSKQQDEEETEKAPNNCINAIENIHLEKVVNCLLIEDNELLESALRFLEQYLFSEIPDPSYPNSIKDSQLQRLKKLLSINSTKSVYEILIKELPVLMVSGLSLNEQLNVDPSFSTTFVKRGHYNNVPTVLPSLSKQLYDIIVRFPEPLRATTWLRCCYESHAASNEIPLNNTDPIPGEVTQISLWKAYEKQFEEVWQTSKTNSNPEWPPLLPAVDFIKNVNSAFPNSEAMVVNLNEGSVEQNTKKKFIIKGIQPRQFVVNIDVGNYEALKSLRGTASDLNTDVNSALPIGTVDTGMFKHSLEAFSDKILNSTMSIKDMKITKINLIARNIFEYLFDEALEFSDSEDLKMAYKLHNAFWLPDLVYLNPSLIETDFIRPVWLKYLL